ncbi:MULTISPECIES: flagellar protein FliT [Pseudomonas]|uniref:Flagellar protein FliT n=1 Tax=Pseudomonas indica TaxID=137658 RepID=A0A1G9D0T3_9PSED|nr:MULTISPECIES: flagellar protein FliT [Pseudomonas]MBU3056663.1 flagellar protein FliT [Pseudomonas indica]PAU54364.1 flagellar protein FliT [Pseudomonas indica]PAU65656.1 flagellar protein FliT [Pseudomonas sp. PIC25]SDK57541.1 hypothetical protein SAMN05216186_108110 [Pseudomonas indica]
MNPAFQRLETTGSALRDALSRQDWTAIGELDQQCRLAVEEAMDAETSDENLLRSRMQELLSLYRELIAVCSREQQRLAGELIQLNQSAQRAKVYQLFG